MDRVLEQFLADPGDFYYRKALSTSRTMIRDKRILQEEEVEDLNSKNLESPSLKAQNKNYIRNKIANFVLLDM